MKKVRSHQGSQLVDLYPRQRTCPVCGEPLVERYRQSRYVVTLSGMLKLNKLGHLIGRTRLRNGLVIAQVAVCLTLLMVGRERIAEECRRVEELMSASRAPAAAGDRFSIDILASKASSIYV